MYVLAPWKKEDPVVRWNLPDRIFFGHGACHILAGVYLQLNIDPLFEALWVKPKTHPGMHVFVSDGDIAFDYHGYSRLDRLIQHHHKVWRHQYPDWEADIVTIDFDLLSELDLNSEGMRGPTQYHGDPVRRAQRFLRCVNHASASSKARALT